MQGYYLDPESNISDQCFAVVYAPRQKRDRFPENCVEVMQSREMAMDKANPAAKRYAARMIGPARSSEGLRLYYLLEWL